MRRLFAALAGAVLLSTPVNAQNADTLLNVSYDIGRELYAAVNVEFAKVWKEKTGRDVTINQSHAGSSRQARAILEGQEADLVTFNQVVDVQILHDRGNLIPADWQKKFPNNASPYYSLPAFVVRKGNPKNVRNWDDLVREDVKSVFPNPKTSGNARYTYLAAYAYALEVNKGDEGKADAFIKTLLSNVPVFDTGGRAATTTFVEREIGDVLITFEAETAAIVKQYGDDAFEVVVPPVSLLAEFPVAVVDTYAKKHGTTELANAYLEYLYSTPGQRLLAEFNNRVHDETVIGETKDRFPEVRLLTVEDVFGGWPKAMATHFESGGKLDSLLVAR